MKTKILAVLLSVLCAPAFADTYFKNRLAEQQFASANYGGAYADVEGTIIRISIDDGGLYMTAGKGAINVIRVEDVDMVRNTMAATIDFGNGPVMTTFKRASNGINWDWDSTPRQQIGLRYIRRLAIPDVVILACATFDPFSRDEILKMFNKTCK